ncbi:hypothetical protein, partial [Micrococcus luteus]|uniref:hypothetical protein n=1 Tax=Micrococcus luteus TaxID=1270 RepID=UPI0033C70687
MDTKGCLFNATPCFKGGRMWIRRRKEVETGTPGLAGDQVAKGGGDQVALGVEHQDGDAGSVPK